MSKIDVKEGLSFERLDGGDVRVEKRRTVAGGAYAIDTVTLDRNTWERVVNAMDVGEDHAGPDVPRRG